MKKSKFKNIIVELYKTKDTQWNTIIRWQEYHAELEKKVIELTSELNVLKKLCRKTKVEDIEKGLNDLNKELKTKSEYEEVMGDDPVKIIPVTKDRKNVLLTLEQFLRLQNLK